jgi:hypothetical protein
MKLNYLFLVVAILVFARIMSAVTHYCNGSTTVEGALLLMVYAPTVGRNFSVVVVFGEDAATAITGTSGPHVTEIITHLHDGYLLGRQERVAFFGINKELMFAPAKDLLFSPEMGSPAKWRYCTHTGLLQAQNHDLWECPTIDSG